MNYLFVELYREIKKTIHRPSRLLNLRYKKVAEIFRSMNWRSDVQGLRFRSYRSYDEYLQHQKSKLPTLDLSEYDRRFPQMLSERIRNDGLLKPGMTVLCLAARIGSEVKAFLKFGCFAVGVDLNPGPDNKYVLYGDFHDIQFPANSADALFTNSLDHALEIEKVIREIRRVLKPDGILVIEAMKGGEEGISTEDYESFFWSEVDDLVQLFEQNSFALIKRSSIEFPWRGEHLCFRAPA